jgi:hypothetical protein
MTFFCCSRTSQDSRGLPKIIQARYLQALWRRYRRDGKFNLDLGQVLAIVASILSIVGSLITIAMLP